MMLPARTVSLPNFFTPRRLLSLSRPLRDEPPAFLCAMTNYFYFFFGLFLAAALAGAAFSVDGVFALALGAAAALAGFFGAGLDAPAAFSLFGAGFSVGWPLASSDWCSASVALARDFAVAAGVCSACATGEASAFTPLGASAFLAGLSAFTSPIAVMRRIVCSCRWPCLRR